MRLAARFRSWLRAILHRSSMEQDLDGELRFHIECRTADLVRQGVPPEEARRRARAEFGAVEARKEECREALGLRFLDELHADLRYGIRILRKSPTVTTVAIASLALGIGANTAIFTLIDAVLLKMLPVKSPQQLVLLNWVARRGPSDVDVRHWLDGTVWNDAGLDRSPNFSYRTLEEIRLRNQAFSDVFAFANVGEMNIAVDGEAGLATGQLVSGNYFSGLGVAAVVGRTITESDDEPSAPPVAVISYGYWNVKFGASLTAVGKTIRLNNVPFTIVGVTAPEFYGLTAGHAVEISTPLRTQPLIEPRLAELGVSLFTAPDHWWLNIVGRLKPGVTEHQAGPALEMIFNQSITEGLQFKSGQKLNIPWMEIAPGGRGYDSLRRQFSKPLFILMTIVGVVLFIACANVANLLLARATARHKEMAVRLGLGAGRRRLVQQMLTESLLLATAGGVCGLILAHWGSTFLVALISRGGNPISLDVRPDLRVLGFTGSACLLTGMLFGLAPALRGTRLDLTPSLKANAGTWRSRGLRFGLAKSLVVSQVGLSLVLLTAAGLFLRTLVNLESVNVGFNRENLLLFGIDPSQSGYKEERLADFCDQVQRGIGALPGVRAVTLSLHSLLSRHLRTDGISVPGYTPRANEEVDVYVLPVGSQFFETMQIPLLLGRGLGPQDNEKSQRVAVINETFARKYFGNQNPIGKQFSFGGPDSPRTEVVGVARDARYTSPRDEIPTTVYQPYRQVLDSINQMHFEVRTAGPASAMAPAVRRVVHDLDKTLPVHDLKTQDEQVDQTLFQERLFAKLSSLFSLLAISLACVGLYGVLSYAVVRRTGEIGIRLALGAQRSTILIMVLTETFMLAFVGAVIGVLAALAAAKLASSQISDLLYGLEVADHVTIVLATLLIIAIVVFAGFLPARKASRVDPMVALRYE